jgi:hypothetical protein
LFRKAFHVGDDGFLGRTRYFSTVDLATSMPSLHSSPTIRGEPPADIGFRHLADQCPDLFWHLRSTRSALLAQFAQ